uniref:Thyroglobulin type-1 domain-containing protein n=1 Tax=Parasteatoda tepidariorum TaxID=114398 RepID=A0A2L2Y212_PARTP
MRIFLLLLFVAMLGTAIGAQITACRLQRKSAKGDDFKPRCNKQGDYAQIQCRSGFCWCANKQGEMLTKSQKGKPDCSGKPY